MGSKAGGIRVLRKHGVVFRVLGIEIVRRGGAGLPQRQGRDREEDGGTVPLPVLPAGKRLFEQVEQKAHRQHEGGDKVIDIARLVHRGNDGHEQKRDIGRDQEDQPVQGDAPLFPRRAELFEKHGEGGHAGETRKDCGPEAMAGKAHEGAQTDGVEGGVF